MDLLQYNLKDRLQILHLLFQGRNKKRHVFVDLPAHKLAERLKVNYHSNSSLLKQNLKTSKRLEHKNSVMNQICKAHELLLKKRQRLLISIPPRQLQNFPDLLRKEYRLLQTELICRLWGWIQIQIKEWSKVCIWAP